ncbi:MAG TPA: hypothetical protein P5055_06130, partial [Candidatus Paceibacterota bacterium]|nr:hypothetical protein [Candidatus Paceibacterota bacterium]
LFTPANSVVAPLKDNVDAWGWENCLWLGLGQKIRKGEWDIARDPIPPSIQEILDYAQMKKVKLVAYAYPTLGWMQNPEWTAWCGGKTGGYIGVDTGVRRFWINHLHEKVNGYGRRKELALARVHPSARKRFIEFTENVRTAFLQINRFELAVHILQCDGVEFDFISG